MKYPVTIKQLEQLMSDFQEVLDETSLKDEIALNAVDSGEMWTIATAALRMMPVMCDSFYDTECVEMYKALTRKNGHKYLRLMVVLKTRKQRFNLFISGKLPLERYESIDRDEIEAILDDQECGYVLPYMELFLNKLKEKNQFCDKYFKPSKALFKNRVERLTFINSINSITEKVSAELGSLHDKYTIIALSYLEVFNGLFEYREDPELSLFRDKEGNVGGFEFYLRTNSWWNTLRLGGEPKELDPNPELDKNGQPNQWTKNRYRFRKNLDKENIEEAREKYKVEVDKVSKILKEHMIAEFGSWDDDSQGK
jgi:hypothetical protein